MQQRFDFGAKYALPLSARQSKRSGRMNFDLTEEQKMWKKSVHDFVAKEIKPKAHEVDESGEFNW